jgi:GNAT superfamily N-acetyltransferase
MAEVRIVNVKPVYCRALEQLQRDCFPTLGEDELMTEAMFLKHCEIFPEGEFVALVDERVVGLGSGFLINFEFDSPDHRFMDIIGGGYYTNHQSDGGWYYGADISVHPEYRGRGIGKKLYDARKHLVKRLNRKGIVAGGLLPGYVQHRVSMSVQMYVEKVVEGTLYDPTLSFQLKNGFVVCSLLKDYIEDEASDNWSALIVWENPDYLPPK